MLRAVLTRSEGGSPLSMGRKRFLSLYGYAETPAERLLDNAFPCSDIIIPTTGEKAPRPSRLTGACGQQRYCRECEKLFSLVDQSYPTYVVCDVLLALFTKVVPTWSESTPKDSAMWARKADPGRNHKCGPACPGHF